MLEPRKPKDEKDLVCRNPKTNLAKLSVESVVEELEFPHVTSLADDDGAMKVGVICLQYAVTLVRCPQSSLH